ncbi:MAG: ABC transporter permease [Propionibacteriaceae bacterium]|jgi:ABC-2 type transport system permease protein|nr:ABC transporter permease [Propionibacteriaceae bacterium]
MSFKRIRLLIWKEFLQLRQDPFLAGILLAAPILQLIVFGYVVAVDINHLNTAIVDLDHSTISRQIDSAFSASQYFTVTEHPATEADLRALMDPGDVQLAVVIPEGTQAALNSGMTAPIGVIVDGSDSQVSSVAGSYASQVIAQAGATSTAISGPSISAQVRVLYNPTLTSINNMLPGLIAVISMISLLVVMSQAVVKERESGTLEQMFVTPIRAGEYIVGKITPYVLLALAQIVIVTTVGLGWFHVPFNGNFWVVALAMALFMMTSIGLGLLVSLISRTRQQAIQTILFFMLPFMILSGFIFPIDSMPGWLQPITYAIPLRYIMEVLRSEFAKGSTFADMATQLWVLAGFGIALFTVAVLATRRRITD